MARHVQLMGLIITLAVTTGGYARDAQTHAAAADSAGVSVSTEAMMDAMGTILGYYHGAAMTTRFCTQRFLDMQADLEASLVEWATRNRPVADAARRVVLERSLVPNEQALDESLQGELRSYLGTIDGMDLEHQKIHCFDTMVMMDDEANDIRHRYAREFELLERL